MAVNANQVLDRADFVWCNGDMFQTQYLRLVDDSAQADDILIEAASESGELFFTKLEIEQAEDMGDGSIKLKNGALVRFLTSAVVH